MVDNDKADELLLADCIEYHKAIHMLSKGLGATPEELAIWAFLGTECGGLDIYTKESGQPEKLPFVDGNFSHDYLPRLRRCWFRRSDVEQFEPQERFITGAALIERWRQYDKDPEDLILMEISRDHLEAYHPVFGGYSQDSLSGNDNSPPLSEYLISDRCPNYFFVEDPGNSLGEFVVGAWIPHKDKSSTFFPSDEIIRHCPITDTCLFLNRS